MPKDVAPARGEDLTNVLVPLIPQSLIDRLDAFLERRDGAGNRGRAAELRKIIEEGVDRREKRNDHRASIEAAQALRTLRAELAAATDQLRALADRLAAWVRP